jgi:hypothetical protein
MDVAGNRMPVGCGWLLVVGEQRVACGCALCSVDSADAVGIGTVQVTFYVTGVNAQRLSGFKRFHNHVLAVF